MDKVKEALAKALVWVKAHSKLVIAVVVVVIVLIVAISLLTGGPKRAVKGYIKGMNNLDADKMLKYYDAQGAVAWTDCEKKAKKFEDAYDDVEDEDIEDEEESIEKGIEYFEDYDEFSVKLIEIKSVEKEDDCKGLYKVKAKVEMSYEDDDDEDSSTKTITFMVYKNKVIASEI